LDFAAVLFFISVVTAAQAAPHAQEEAQAAQSLGVLRTALAAQEAANADRAARSAASAASLLTLQARPACDVCCCDQVDSRATGCRGFLQARLADMGRQREAARQGLAEKQAAASAAARRVVAADGSAPVLLAKARPAGLGHALQCGRLRSLLCYMGCGPWLHDAHHLPALCSCLLLREHVKHWQLP